MNTVPLDSTRNIRLCQLAAGKLLSVLPYQETRNMPRRVAKIIKNFDPLRLGVIKVWEHDGVFDVVDGKHRCIAIKQKFGDGHLVNCEVFNGTYEDAARVFSLQDKDKGRLTPYQEFFGMNESKGGSAVLISATIEKHGLTLADVGRSADGVICCIRKVEQIYQALGNESFDDFIGLMVSTWGGNQKSLENKVLGGALLFYKTYKNQFDRSKFVKKLKGVDPAKIIRDGDGDLGAKGDMRYAKAILREYNHAATGKRLPYLFNG